MTAVCIVAAEEVGDDLAAELFSYPTARAALSAYELRSPYANAVLVETISLGAAVALLNDLDWYLVRLAQDALVREPSVAEGEYLSRALATAIRDGEVDPDDVGDRLKIYGVVEAQAPEEGGEGGDDEDGAPGDASGDAASDAPVPAPPGDPRGRLVEPMYVARTGDETPGYDLRTVVDTVVVRVTEEEFR